MRSQHNVRVRHRVAGCESTLMLRYAIAPDRRQESNDQREAAAILFPMSTNEPLVTAPFPTGDGRCDSGLIATIKWNADNGASSSLRLLATWFTYGGVARRFSSAWREDFGSRT